MHMARRAAAWAAWAAWTCNTGIAGAVKRERASARSFLCTRQENGPFLVLDSCKPPSIIVGESQAID
jgi:hypothetical protein